MNAFKTYNVETLSELPIFDVDAESLNDLIAKHLESKIQPIKNSDIIKLGSGKQHAPENRNWFFKRAAGILRQATKSYIQNKSKTIGLKYLRFKYRTSKNRGVRPSRIVAASGGHILCALNELASAGFLDKSENGFSLSANGFNFMKDCVQSIQESQ